MVSIWTGFCNVNLEIEPSSLYDSDKNLTIVRSGFREDQNTYLGLAERLSPTFII